MAGKDRYGRVAKFTPQVHLSGNIDGRVDPRKNVPRRSVPMTFNLSQRICGDLRKGTLIVVAIPPSRFDQRAKLAKK
jgi:hypothetical protein